MLVRFIILIALYAKLAVGQDMDIDANIRIDPNFVKSIKQSLDDELELFRFKNEKEYSGDPFTENLKRFAETEPDRLVMTPQKNSREIINAYQKRSLHKGVDGIESIGGYLEHALGVTRAGITPIVQRVTSYYILQINEYFSDLIKAEPGSKLDKDYMILDMVNSVSLITRNIQRKLLDRILDLDTSDGDSKKETLIDTFRVFNDFDKRQEVEFVCEHFMVCRPNPAFSGYVYKLLEEVLELDIDKFHYFVIKSAMLLGQHQTFFGTLLGTTVIEWFKTTIENVAWMNIAELKQAVLSLHSVILRRYKIDDRDEKETQANRRAKAILADIIDVTFGLDGDALYGAQIKRLITEVKNWRLDLVTDIEEKLDDTIKYVVEGLQTNLTPSGKKEIKALVDIIFYNISEDRIAKEHLYLMVGGSKFVKGLVHRALKPLNDELF